MDRSGDHRANYGSLTLEQKIFENRVRRVAHRQLLQLRRVRRRDRLAWDYGRYRLTDAAGNVVAKGGLDDMYIFLTQPSTRHSIDQAQDNQATLV